MSNSLFQKFGAQQDPMAQFFKEFNQFKNNFKGDPKAEVEKMMQTGQLSQEEFNEYAQMTNSIVQFMR